jgi:hypothetical protein
MPAHRDGFIDEAGFRWRDRGLAVVAILLSLIRDHRRGRHRPRHIRPLGEELVALALCVPVIFMMLRRVPRQRILGVSPHSNDPSGIDARRRAGLRP